MADDVTIYRDQSVRVQNRAGTPIRVVVGRQGPAGPAGPRGDSVEVTPEQFGASAITDFDSPPDSTTALAALVTYVNENPNAQVRLRGIYYSSSVITLTSPNIVFKGGIASDCGFLFDDCDGISVTQSRFYDSINFRKLLFLTNAENTRKAFVYSGATSTGDAMTRYLDGCSFVGLDKYLAGKLGASSDDVQGWLQSIKLTQGDRFVINNPYIRGAESDRGDGFPEATIGIEANDSTSLVIRNPEIWIQKTGIKLRGQSEGNHLLGGTLIANYDGFDAQFDTSPANGHTIDGAHISSINSNINLGVGGSETPGFNSIVNCLLFCRSATDSPSAGFTHINAKGQTQIIGNTMYTPDDVDPVADSHVGIKADDSGTQIIGNFFRRVATCVEVQATASNTLISHNVTRDDSGTLAVAPVVDNGSFTRYGPNYGDRYSTWPSLDTPAVRSRSGGVFKIFTGTGATTSPIVSMTATYLASAVNYLDALPAVTGSGAQLRALGSDTNIDLLLTPKGTGKVKVATPSRVDITNTTDAATNEGIRIQSDRATPAAEDTIFQSFYLSNSIGTQKEFVRISAMASAITDSSESARLRFSTMAGGTLTDRLDLVNNALRPSTNDGLALGSATLRWSDLFLASGAVINFNNGNLTITHAAGALSFAGGTNGYVFDGPIKGLTTTVSGLPAAGTAGRRAFVTDASATTFGSIVAGSGSNNVPVYDDGTNWLIG